MLIQKADTEQVTTCSVSNVETRWEKSKKGVEDYLKEYFYCIFASMSQLTR